MDCRSVSAAERVRDCDEGVQCPNERNPMFFMQAIYAFPVDLRDGTALAPSAALAFPRRHYGGNLTVRDVHFWCKACRRHFWREAAVRPNPEFNSSADCEML